MTHAVEKRVSTMQYVIRGAHD